MVTAFSTCYLSTPRITFNTNLMPCATPPLATLEKGKERGRESLCASAHAGVCACVMGWRGP